MNNLNGLDTFVLKKAQVKARIWPWLAYLLQLRSTVAQRARVGACPEIRVVHSILISQNAFINKFKKVNSPITLSTSCLLLLIRILSWRFCGGVDFLKLIVNYIVWDKFGGLVVGPHISAVGYSLRKDVFSWCFFLLTGKCRTRRGRGRPRGRRSLRPSTRCRSLLKRELD